MFSSMTAAIINDVFSQEDNKSKEDVLKEKLERLVALDSINDDSFNPVDYRAVVDFVVDTEDKENASKLFELLPGNAVDVFVSAVEKGPLDAGDVPSKDGRTVLIQLGLMVFVVGPAKENDQLAALTYEAYLFGRLAGSGVPGDDD